MITVNVSQAYFPIRTVLKYCLNIALTGHISFHNLVYTFIVIGITT